MKKNQERTYILKIKKMKKSKTGTINFTKELFVETIDEIKKQYDHDEKCSEAFKVILPNDFISGYSNHILKNQLIKILQLSFNDAHKDSWIEYFMWELEFGKKYKKGMATEKDGTEINLSDASHLFDFLIKNAK